MWARPSPESINQKSPPGKRSSTGYSGRFGSWRILINVCAGSVHMYINPEGCTVYMFPLWSIRMDTVGSVVGIG